LPWAGISRPFRAFINFVASFAGNFVGNFVEIARNHESTKEKVQFAANARETGLSGWMKRAD
jgi:hypothetical protein